MNIENEVLVKQIELRKPADILNRIKIRGMDDGIEKEKLRVLVKQKTINDNACYFEWLEENHITEFKFILIWRGLSFTFINSDDAIAFKLRWM